MCSLSTRPSLEWSVPAFRSACQWSRYFVQISWVAPTEPGFSGQCDVWSRVGGRVSEDVPAHEMEEREAQDQSCFQTAVPHNSGSFRGITNLPSLRLYIFVLYVFWIVRLTHIELALLKDNHNCNCYEYWGHSGGDKSLWFLFGCREIFNLFFSLRLQIVHSFDQFGVEEHSVTYGLVWETY